MAVGNGEMVHSFDLDSSDRPGAPKVGRLAGVCGRCGALVAQGFEAIHSGWHNANSATLGAISTTRQARGAFETNSP
jgi:hypothetical protein